MIQDRKVRRDNPVKMERTGRMEKMASKDHKENRERTARKVTRETPGKLDLKDHKARKENKVNKDRRGNPGWMDCKDRKENKVFPEKMELTELTGKPAIFTLNIPLTQTATR